MGGSSPPMVEKRTVTRSRREEFCGLSRSVARSVRTYVSTRDELRTQKDRPLSEPACYVLLSSFVIGRGEDFFRRAIFHQFAQIHEGREVGRARGLLHVMGDDHD